MQRYDGSDSPRIGARRRRRLRRCGRLAGETAVVADPYRDCDLGWSHWPGAARRRCSARAGQVARDAALPDSTLGRRRAFLGRRIDALTDELDRVKTLLSAYSRNEARDRE